MVQGNGRVWPKWPRRIGSRQRVWGWHCARGDKRWWRPADRRSVVDKKHLWYWQIRI